MSGVAISDESTEKSHAEKALDAVREFVTEFDLPLPLWPEKNIRDFKRHACTCFIADSLLGAPPFDYLETEVLKE